MFMHSDFSWLGVLVWLILTMLCFALPLLPALKEFKFPADSKPLMIQSEHTGNVDFRAWELMSAVPDLEDLGNRTELVPLEGDWRKLLRAKPTLECKTQQSLSVAAPVITSLVSAADVRVEEGVRIQKLLQARNVHCLTGSKMGLFTSASEDLVMEPGVNFTKVAARRVLTLPKAAGGRHEWVHREIEVASIAKCHERHMGDFALQAGQKITGSVVIRGKLVMAEGSSIDGNVKVHGSARLGRGCVVTGSLFVEGNVYGLPNVLVGGPLSSTGVIRLGGGSQVGTPSSPSSVMGQFVRLGLGVQIFGSVSSVARGTVLKGV